MNRMVVLLFFFFFFFQISHVYPSVFFSLIFLNIFSVYRVCSVLGGIWSWDCWPSCLGAPLSPRQCRILGTKQVLLLCYIENETFFFLFFLFLTCNSFKLKYETTATCNLHSQYIIILLSYHYYTWITLWSIIFLVLSVWFLSFIRSI